MKMTEGMLSWEYKRHLLFILHLSMNIKRRSFKVFLYHVLSLCSLQFSREDEIITSAFRWANNTNNFPWSRSRGDIIKSVPSGKENHSNTHDLYWAHNALLTLENPNVWKEKRSIALYIYRKNVWVVSVCTQCFHKNGFGSS